MTFRVLSFAAVAVAGANATLVSRSCLSETEATGKYADDEASYQPYRRANVLDMQVPDHYRITQAKVCTGSNHGHLKGF